MEKSPAWFLVRLGVAFSFLYPPVAAYFDPYSWIGYFPSFIKGFIPDELLLHSFGILEILIGLWILSGIRIFIPSALATLLLFLIVLFNWPQLDVLFRDISIALASLALVIVSFKEEPFLRQQNPFS
jgi:uncharacterized membrane protein YphA (DoxX/SURF4 family)